MLHKIIEDITLDDMVNSFDTTYNLIAKRFFEIFKAPKENEITVDFWYSLLEKRK